MSHYDGRHEPVENYSMRSRVFNRLREDILNGRYAEHEELREANCRKASRTGVRLTPISSPIVTSRSSSCSAYRPFKISLGNGTYYQRAAARDGGKCCIPLAALASVFLLPAAHTGENPSDGAPEACCHSLHHRRGRYLAQTHSGREQEDEDGKDQNGNAPCGDGRGRDDQDSLADDQGGAAAPSRMARMVPLGLFHISFRLYSCILAPLGVMVAHFTATPCFRVALAESTVTWSSVAFLFSSPRS